jgi:hypothetical protein
MGGVWLSAMRRNGCMQHLCDCFQKMQRLWRMWEARKVSRRAEAGEDEDGGGCIGAEQAEAAALAGEEECEVTRIKATGNQFRNPELDWFIRGHHQGCSLVSKA